MTASVMHWPHRNPVGFLAISALVALLPVTRDSHSGSSPDSDGLAISY